MCECYGSGVVSYEETKNGTINTNDAGKKSDPFACRYVFYADITPFVREVARVTSFESGADERGSCKNPCVLYVLEVK